MKNYLLIFSLLLALVANGQKRITLSGAFALYPITVKWAEEFKKTHPGVQIDISAGGAGKGITDALAGQVNIAMVSRDLTPQEIKNGGYPIAVAKDAVLPTINTNNPLAESILKTGIKKNILNDIFITGKVKVWSKKNKAPIHVYTRSDAAGAAETWAKYFSKKQEDLLGVAVYGDPGLAQAVKKDPLGIGFNNIVYVYDSKSRKASNGVIPIPIDTNNNGKLDPEENFYGDVDQLTDAIAAGKYPSPPARDLYFMTKGKPQDPTVKEFIEYVLTDGQKFIDAAGYVKLSGDKIKTSIQKIK